MQIIKSSRSKQLLAYLDCELDKILTFILSFATAYGISSLIQIRSNNPYSISNIANITAKWNPENNYLKVAFVVVCGLFIFWGLSKLRRGLSQKWFRVFIALIATSLILFGSLVPHATDYSLDSFHSGEQLAPSIAYNHGKQLYSEIFFLHGAGADVLMPNLSFTLFNHGQPSIGAYVLLTAILQALSIFLFFILVARLIRYPGFYLFTVLYFLTTIYSGFSYEKDIPLYIVVAIFWFVLNKPLAAKYRLVLLGCIGLISSLGIFISYDVGTIMILTAVLASLALVFLQSLNNNYVFKLPRWKLGSFLPSLAIITGGLLGQLLILLLIDAKNYISFIQTFFEIIRYQGLMFDYPIKGLDANTLLFWLPIILLTISSFMLSCILFSQYKKLRQFTPNVLLACLLMFISIVYLRFGVGRPDVGHIAMASPIILLAGFFIIPIYMEQQFKYKQRQFWPILLFIILLGWPQLSFEPTKIFAAGNIQPARIKEFIKLPQKPDNEWLNQEQLKVTHYIKGNSTPADKLFIVVPEPLYYYTTDRGNPSRFAISWFADPKQYTDELLSSLKKSPPKFIIYDSLSSPYRISDSIPINDRFPEVNDWIVTNYRQRITIENTTVLYK